jgi:toxin ParE1/3/4
MSGWTVRLADRAAQDVEDILDWTLEQFGPLQLETSYCQKTHSRDLSL